MLLPRRLAIYLVPFYMCRSDCRSKAFANPFTRQESYPWLPCFATGLSVASHIELSDAVAALREPAGASSSAAANGGASASALNGRIAGMSSAQQRQQRAQAVSLSRLVESTLGRPLDKSQQRSVWSRRPLLPQQLAYAANDAHCLVAALDALLAAAARRASAASRNEAAGSLLVVGVQSATGTDSDIAVDAGGDSNASGADRVEEEESAASGGIALAAALLPLVSWQLPPAPSSGGGLIAPAAENGAAALSSSNDAPE